MNDLATTQRNPVAQLRQDLKLALPTFGLKNEREQERMASVLMVAVEKDNELVFADRQSLIAAVRQCANHGLVPDGNEATLQVYNTKVKVNGAEKWIKKVQYQPMVRGIINRVLKSGKVLTFWAEVVYEGEDFRIDTAQGDRRPVHSPDHFNRTGKIIGVYAVAKMKNGAIDCEPMNMAEIQKVRNVAKTKNVWDNWFEEKAKVAVMRRLSKRLPLSAEDMDFILNPQEHDLEQPIRDVTPEQKPNLAQRLTITTPEEEPDDMDQDTGPNEADLSQDDNHWTDTIDTDSGFPGGDAFTEGVKAARAGMKRTMCPYQNDHGKAADWLAGFDGAKEAEK